MPDIIALFKILRESSLLTDAFIFGAIALFVAIIGNFKTIIELSPSTRIVLGALGVFLMVLGFGGYILSLQSTPTLVDASPKVTPIIFVAPTNTAQPTYTPYPTFTQPPVPKTQSTPPVKAVSTSTVISSQTSSDCIATPHYPLSQSNYTFPGSVHVVDLWRQNGQSPWGTKEVAAVVLKDLTIIDTGGSVFTYPSAECESIARDQMLVMAKQRQAIVVTEQALRNAGMIR